MRFPLPWKPKSIIIPVRPSVRPSVRFWTPSRKVSRGGVVYNTRGGERQCAELVAQSFQRLPPSRCYVA